TLRFEEGISHSSPNDNVRRPVQEIFDDQYLIRYLSTTNNSGKGVLTLMQYLLRSRHFSFHYLAKHFFIRTEITGNDSRRGMGPVGGAKSIIDIYISQCR